MKPDQSLDSVHREADRSATRTTMSAEARAEWAIPGSIYVEAYHALKSGDPTDLEAGANRCAVS